MRTDLVERAARVVNDPPVLVNMISQRVRQLNQGRPALVNTVGMGGLGQADIALLEIIEGKVVLDLEDEVKEAEE